MLTRLTRIHPGLLLAALSTFGLVVAVYLSTVALTGNVPVCGPIEGCVEVATSAYAWIGPLPVAILGVLFSTVLLASVVGWWKTDDRRLLAAHYGLKLSGVTFEVYLLYLQLFVIGAICIWCVLYGMSMSVGLVITIAAWRRRDRVPVGAGW